MSSQHGLYKFVTCDTNEIIYIGKTNSCFKSRIDCHKRGNGIDEKFNAYKGNCKVYIAHLPNATETDILERGLINKYKPILNIADNFDGFSGFIHIQEPEWIEYVDEEKDKNKKTNEPTLYQLREAQSKYDFYVNDVKCLEETDHYGTCIKNKKDIHYLGESVYLNGHIVQHGEIIAWQYFVFHRARHVKNVINEYNSYVRYAQERSIPIKALVHQKFTSFTKDYADEIEEGLHFCAKEFERRSREREEKDRQEIERVHKEEIIEKEKRAEFIEKAIEFLDKHERLYIYVPYESKNTFKKYGCYWDAETKAWFVHRDTWKYVVSPEIFLRRLHPDYAYDAIKQGLIVEDELIKTAKIQYKSYMRDKYQIKE